MSSTASPVHVVVGAGPVGRAIAAQLAAAGQQVRVLTRSGTGPALPGVELRAVDATRPELLAEAARGATVLYNAANPRDYHRWESIWPPLAASLLSTARTTGAVLATVGNLYPYGPVDGPMYEDLPDAATYTNGRVRARMWADALEAHRAGDVRVVEVRASDYAGGGAYSHLSVAADSLVAGKTARLIGDPDQPHSWTGTADTARTLIAAAASADAHGRTWLVPTNAPRTQREVLTEVASAADLPLVRIAPLGRLGIRAVGMVMPAMRPMADTYYQFDRPFVVDDRAAREAFGIAPTPWAELVAEVADTALTARRTASQAA